MKKEEEEEDNDAGQKIVREIKEPSKKGKEKKMPSSVHFRENFQSEKNKKFKNNYFKHAF